MDSSQSNNNDDNNNSIINSNKYGYDETLFISPPADFLRCCICSLILRNPIQIVDCGHKYCGGCFQRLRTSIERNNEPLRCPIDRNVVEVSKVFEDIAMKRVVGSLQVRCYQADRGCDWIGELTELEVHGGKCQYLCLHSQQQAPDHELLQVVQRMGERIERVENSLAEKEKEVLHHKLTVMEMKTKYEGKLEELEQVKSMVEETRSENLKFRSEVQLKEQVHEQRLINMELKLSEALQNVDLLIRKVEEVQKENDVLEQEVKEYKERAEISEQNVELRFKTNTDRVCSLEDKVRPLEELLKAKETEPVEPVMRPIASLYASSSQQQQLQPKKVSLMQPRSKEDENRVLISNDNVIQFKNLLTGTVIFPPGVVPKNAKVFYEVDVVKGGSQMLRVGWTTKEFLSGSFVGGDAYSYSYGVGASASHRRHKGSAQPWGKAFMTDGHNVIGVTIDMANGKMMFGLNGQWNHPMGVAFENIDVNKNFFPAISFVNGELKVNFGERYFAYGPPDGSYVNIIDII